MWGCGLKRNIALTDYEVLLVTPHVGVWIETQLYHQNIPQNKQSPPMWGCGLKQHTVDVCGKYN